MAGKQSFEEGASIYKPPLFCGLIYKYWEARMKIFVESIDQGIWIQLRMVLTFQSLKRMVLSLQNLGLNGPMMNVRWPSLIVLLKT